MIPPYAVGRCLITLITLVGVLTPVVTMPRVLLVLVLWALVRLLATAMRVAGGTTMMLLAVLSTLMPLHRERVNNLLRLCSEDTKTIY
jgi:hypothetical protein